MLKRAQKRIYLDTSSTTPVDKRVLKKMEPYFTAEFGNPSSIHKEGVLALQAKEEARQTIANILHAHADEIIFTNGGTESDNLAILGIARAMLRVNKISKPGHIVTTVIEHSAVLEPCKELEKEGWQVSYIPVSDNGLVDLAELKRALRPETVLVSVMYANNEIGTIEPIKEVAKIVREARKKNNASLPYFHTDACQAPRFLPLDVEKLGVDAMSLNGSKIYGPKGIGCLYLKRNIFCEPLIYGGGQERNLRSGTENVPAIVGFAAALQLCERERDKESYRLTQLRNYFIVMLEKIPDAFINGDQAQRLPHNVNVTFQDVFAELLLLELDHKGIACSTGSACSYHTKDESHVIMELGKDRKYADCTLRFTLGRDTTKADLDNVLKVLPPIVEKIRSVHL